MSLQKLQADPLFYQRLLRASGFYTGKLDGDFGAKSKEAEKLFIAKYNELQKQYGRLDERSEANIYTLVVQAQQGCREMIRMVNNMPGMHTVKVIAGTRTYAEQDAIFMQNKDGKDNDGDGRVDEADEKVTNAKGGQSNHNFGIAWDIGLFDGNGKYLQSPQDYGIVGRLIVAKLPHIEWGGTWKSLPDMPHYQLRTKVQGTRAVRAAFEAGEQYI